ncbi:hypothetical protein JOM56_014025 [Amanita muscaria]
MFSIAIFVAIYVLWRVVPSVAYSWQLNAAPTQCTDISITVTGTDGQPPYSVLVVPFGSSPSGTDVRGVIQKNFDGNSNSVNVPIKYPAKSQFVAVVSDSAGFGTGGTSAPTLVAESGDNSCFDVSQSWSPKFWFFLKTPGVVQCSTTQIWWNNTANVQGTPSFVGVIPGGLSFPISEESGISIIATTPIEEIGFSWLPRIREGTQLVIVGGDNRGLGTGGQVPYTIAHSDNSSCVTAGRGPSITPGAVAGAVKSTRNTTAIIGGAVGGSVGFVALCAVALFYILHRRNRGQYPKGSTVYSINPERPGIMTKPNHPLSHYGVEPFANQGSPINGFGYENAAASMMQVTASAQNGMNGDRLSTGPQSVVATSSCSGPGSGSMIFPSPHRKISTTIIQHKDGGPGEAPAENGPETINLPPTYDSLTSAQQDTTRQEPAGKSRVLETDQTNRRGPSK